MNYETDIKPLEDAGQTDGQIVATLQQDTRHKRDIMATGEEFRDLLHILSSQFRVLGINDSGGWNGSLVDYMRDVNQSVELAEGFSVLLAHLQITGRKVACSEDAEMGALVTGFAQVVDQLWQAKGHPAGEVMSFVYAITGGPIWAGLTVGQIQDARAAYLSEQSEMARQQAIDQLRAEIENDYINPAMADGVTTAVELRAAIKAGL